ncbi:MAG: cytochrome c maturation protein CcmE [Candidatus Schekmanbacteria bacterium]|nr:cytochrome c maturation protein CcmE [Candidatus Schekmanbacteria bacterium]
MSATARITAGVVAVVVAAAALGYIAYGGIGENLVYYWSPTELVQAGPRAFGPIIRLGGLVKQGTVEWNKEANFIAFQVTDGKEQVKVENTGAPTQMFREGIGVVVEGTFSTDGVFRSNRLMVKHSNEYRAPQDGVPVEELYKTMEEEVNR